MVTPIYNFTPELAPCLDSRLRMESSFFVICVGFSTEEAEGFTAAYQREFSANWLSLQRATCRVSATVIVYVDRFRFDAALKSLSHIPAVIVLNEDVFYSKLTKRYVRKLKVPLVRVTSTPTAVVELSKDDYYNGVCATILKDDLNDSSIVCPTLDYALLVSIRLNTDVIDRKKQTAPTEAADSASEDLRKSTTAIPLEITQDRAAILGTDSGTGFEPVYESCPMPSAALYKHARDKTSIVIRAIASTLFLIAVGAH